MNIISSYFEGYTIKIRSINSEIRSKFTSTLDSVQYFIGFKIQQSQSFQICVKNDQNGNQSYVIVDSTKLERWEQIEQIKRILEKYEIVDNDLMKVASNLLSQVSEKNLKVQFSEFQIDLHASNNHIIALGKNYSFSSTYRKIYNSGELIFLCERTLRKHLTMRLKTFPALPAEDIKSV